MALRQRLQLALALLLAALLLGGGGLVVLHARQAVLAETHSSFQLAAALLRASGEPSPELLTALSELRHLEVAPERRREVAAPSWFVALVRPPEQKLRLGALRIAADPGDEIEEAWQEARLFLGFLLLLAAGNGLLLFWTVAAFLRELSPLLLALARIERGELSARLPPPSFPELRELAERFNRMAGALERAREENHRLLQRLLELREEERRRLARDLHDDLGQTLSGLKMAAFGLRRQTQTAEPLVQLADHALRTLRQLLDQLHPEELELLGLRASIEALLERWRQVAPHISFRLEVGLERRLEPERAIHLYRIVQEAVANAVRHSGASLIEVVLREEGERLFLAVRDNGRGMEGEASGFGLASMRERVAFLGGEMTLRSRKGRRGPRGGQKNPVGELSLLDEGGTAIEISVPLS